MINREAISAAIEQDAFISLWNDFRFLKLLVTRIANDGQNEKPE